MIWSEFPQTKKIMKKSDFCKAEIAIIHPVSNNLMKATLIYSGACDRPSSGHGSGAPHSCILGHWRSKYILVCIVISKNVPYITLCYSQKYIVGALILISRYKCVKMVKWPRRKHQLDIYVSLCIYFEYGVKKGNPVFGETMTDIPRIVYKGNVARWLQLGRSLCIPANQWPLLLFRDQRNKLVWERKPNWIIPSLTLKIIVHFVTLLLCNEKKYI